MCAASVFAYFTWGQIGIKVSRAYFTLRFVHRVLEGSSGARKITRESTTEAIHLAWLYWVLSDKQTNAFVHYYHF